MRKGLNSDVGKMSITGCSTKIAVAHDLLGGGTKEVYASAVGLASFESWGTFGIQWSFLGCKSGQSIGI